MKTTTTSPIKSSIRGALAAALALCLQAPPLQAEPPGVIQYQGRLSVDGENFDGTGYFKFALVAELNGVEVLTWSNDGQPSFQAPPSEPTHAVPVSVNKGHYSIGLGDADVPGMADGIQSVHFSYTGITNTSLRVWFGKNANGPFEQITPDHRFTSTPYALSAARATTANHASTAAMADRATTADSATSVVDGRVENPTFLGTRTAAPLDLFVFDERALRLEYPTTGDAPNITGGFGGNVIEEGEQGSVISGGGKAPHGTQQIIGSFATIGGGAANSVDTDYATIGGGRGNTAQGAFSAIPGGLNNSTGTDALYATIGGGRDNTAQGASSAIPGGRNNSTGTNARYAFAAGQGARANHPGTFVWADSVGVEAGETFTSTRDNQFLIRASGGVGIGTANPIASVRYHTAWTGVHVKSSSYGLGIIEGTSGSRIHLRTNGNDSETQNFVITNSNDLVKLEWLEDNLAPRLTAMTLDKSGNAKIWKDLTAENIVLSKDLTAVAINITSDRNAKKGFAPVDPQDVLKKVAAMPITSWHYKQDSDTTHIGPMAQDFHAAFGTGVDDKHIATVDADGVALAAIQALHDLVEDQRAVIQNLEERLEAIESCK